MFAIVFFTTVILFSVFLFVSAKVAEYFTSRKSNTTATKADIDIRPVPTHFHMGHYRFTA
ncbi:MAG: hypothetical protein IKX25_01910 [Bacteroidales bacterium]|nr:hypothetical protein [Bacteroidales bacterium]